jgi:MoaA/NifB/PqqE/SkfB family radical SAM enzyme
LRNTLKKFRNANWFLGHLYAYKTLHDRNKSFRAGKPVVFNAELFFDTRCNYRCVHCSISKFQKQENKKYMDIAEIERVADELCRVKCFLCCLVGGEPTLRQDLPDIVNIFHKRHILPTLITNGSLLDKNCVLDLKKAGIFSVGVSFNGGSPDNHDSFVQHAGAYEKALEALTLLKKYGILRSICVVPTHENLNNGDYDALIRFSQREGLRVNVNYPALAGEFTGDYGAMLTNDELTIARSYFNLPNVTSDFTVLADKYECPAGRKKIYILPDGSVTPCTFIHISFGNILHEPIEEIMSRIWSTPEFMRRPDICLTGESIEWNKNFLTPVFQSEKVPLFYMDHPKLSPTS